MPKPSTQTGGPLLKGREEERGRGKGERGKGKEKTESWLGTSLESSLETGSWSRVDHLLLLTV